MKEYKSEFRMVEILNFIKNYISIHNYPPSVREIGKACNMSSTATVYYYLNKLQDNNLIKKSPSKNRAIELRNDNPMNYSASKVPLVGKITAGNPILATQSIEEYVTIPPEIFHNLDELFMLEVKGDSMIEAGIFNGDKIIVHKQNTAENGEIVAALIDNSATVKRFYKENNYIRLKPSNAAMKDIILDNVVILGVVVGLIRKFN